MQNFVTIYYIKQIQMRQPNKYIENRDGENVWAQGKGDWRICLLTK